ncbi:hypothetical protein ACQ4PT_061541 [Festuca glaucescens]
MARHVTRVADGYVDIYARLPDNATFDSSEEENGVDHQEIAQGQHPVDHGLHQVEHQVELQVEHQVEHQVEYQVEHQTVASSEMFLEAENVEQRRSMKLPVVRAPIQDKGKESVKSSAHEGEDGGESSDSDYDVVLEVDSEDSSADDDEAICYRQQALELKNRVKRKMLGEEEVKITKVPEEFIVPEDVKLEQDDGSECFDSEDELSYDEDSDGEGNVRTRRTKHRVYDESADVKVFELGQALHDTGEFKQADLDDYIAPCCMIDVYDQEGLRPREEGKSRRSLKEINCQEKVAFRDARCVALKTITKESALQASSSAQQQHAQLQEKHALYVEKRSTVKKQAPGHAKKQAPGHAQQQAPVHVQPTQQPRPFVLPKKKQTKSYDGASQSLQIPRSQTIPMSEVVIESVPKHGRMKWYLWGNEEGGDGQE